MSGTDIAYNAISLRTLRIVLSAYAPAMPCAVLPSRAQPMRPLYDVRYRHSFYGAISLRVRYAMSGADIAYGGGRRRRECSC
eukprot:483830-Rhodomonas_salina.3